MWQLQLKNHFLIINMIQERENKQTVFLTEIRWGGREGARGGWGSSLEHVLINLL